jgi:signal transduction histidine kinase
MAPSVFRTVSGRLNQGRSRWLLPLAFLTIALFFAAGSAAVLYRSRQIRRSTQAIVQEALQSVQLVTEMGLDSSRERRLVGTHILEKDADGKAKVEEEIAQVGSDFRSAAKAYEPLTTFPGERSAWLHLQADVAGIRGPVANVLALSRQNQLAAAREAFYELDEQYADVSFDVDELIRINREAAETQVQQVRDLQLSVSNFQTVLMLLGIGSTLLVAWWTTRLIADRETQLTQYSEMLEDRNRELDAFAGRVAHDLRAPLSNVNLAASQLAQRTVGDTRTFTILQQSVRRMEGLIEDLLALSAVGANPLGKCDPAVAASQVLEDLLPRVTREGGTLNVDVASAIVRCGEGLLRQVLWNLADNAIKYRRPEEPVQITIAGRPANGRVYELRISDNGAGMSPEDSAKAFDPFYRARQARQTPGTGLGLSIVKRVVDASGGTISVDSQPGRGTTFIIRLAIDADSERLGD